MHSMTRCMKACFGPTICFLVVVASSPALAQSAGDWASSVNEAFSYLTSGVTSIAAVLIGLALTAFGLFSAVMQSINWQRFWYLIFGSVVVMVGAAFADAFISRLA